MCSLNPIDECLQQLAHKGTAIEIGTYYAGWATYLSRHFEQVITIQTPNRNKLNHIEDTTEGEFSEQLPWKAIMRSRIPEQYHQRYDFNYLADQVFALDNVVTILQESPPSVHLPWTWDLCTIDISRDPAEHQLQYEYWRNSANAGAKMLMGIYKPRAYDKFDREQTAFLDNINEPWQWVAGDDNYIIVDF
jgi:hypothetical protein